MPLGVELKIFCDGCIKKHTSPLDNMADFNNLSADTSAVVDVSDISAIGGIQLFSAIKQ